MNTQTKSRPAQLIRTDDSSRGIVRFYDRREADQQSAFIGAVDVSKLPQEALFRAARHGITQNILDASNKLTGDDRVDFIRQACATVQGGGWASAPVDAATAREKVVAALMKLGIYTQAQAEAIADGQVKIGQ